MSQDKAHPTPPAVPGASFQTVPLEPTMRMGKAGVLAGAKSTFAADMIYRAMIGAAPLAAPVASNTTAEPAPIQPAGVEVEEAEPDLTIAYMCGFSDGKKARLGAAGVEVERDVKRAREILARLCDKGLVSMSIPARDDDEDMVLSRIINLAASQGDRGKT